MRANRRIVLGGALGALAAPRCGAAQVVGRSTRIVAGFPAGGTVDLVSRLLAERLRPAWAPSIIVENRAGAVGRLAIEATRAAEGDGTTILVTPAAMLTIFPHTYPNLRYDPLVDLAAVSPLVTYPFGLAVGPAVPDTVRSLDALATWARARPDTPFATPAAGSAPHFIGMEWARSAGIALSHIPYRGAAPAIQDALGGTIPIVINVLGDQVPHHRNGRLRILAVTSAERSDRLLDVPTFAEQGWPSLVQEEWFGAFLPPGTPAPLVDRLALLLRDIALIPEYREALLRLELTPSSAEPGAFSARILAEKLAWKPIVAASGFRAED